MANINNRARKVNTLRRLNGDKCWVCGLSIDFTLTHPHPLSRTLDHVIELQDEGTNQIFNLELAHQICNMYRSTFKPIDVKRMCEIVLKMQANPNAPAPSYLPKAKKAKKQRRQAPLTQNLMNTNLSNALPRGSNEALGSLMNVIYRDGDVVEIHSFGSSAPSSETFFGIIRGVAVNYGNSPATIWIVQMTREEVDKILPDSPFCFCTIPQACLRKA